MINYRVRRRMHAVVGLPDRHGHHVTWDSPANPDFKEMGEERYNHKSTPLLAMHSCIAGHVAQMRNLVTAINHDQPVRRH